MAQAEMTTLGQLKTMSLATPSDVNDWGICPTYITGHPVRLMAVIHIITTYLVVVNHGSTLSITSLQISHVLLILVSWMLLLPSLHANTPPDCEGLSV
jgi:hypothetical protein